MIKNGKYLVTLAIGFQIDIRKTGVDRFREKISHRSYVSQHSNLHRNDAKSIKL